MPGLFPRVHTWVSKEVLTYTDLNAEFDNIIANCEADTLGGFSANQAEMQQQTDPGSVGSESLAVNISGELERIRFVLARIVGKTYWYEAPDSSLSSAAYKPVAMFAPKYGTKNPNGLVAESGFYAIEQGGTYPVIDGSNAKYSFFALKNNPPSEANIFTIDDALTSNEVQSISCWFKSFAVNDTIIFNQSLGLKVSIDVTGVLKVEISTQDPLTDNSKIVLSDLGSNSVAGLGFKHLLVTYQIANLATDFIKVYLDGTLEAQITNYIFVAAPERLGSYTQLMGYPQPTNVDGFYSNNALPNASTNPWTRTTTGGPANPAISNGIMTFISASGTTQLYSKTMVANNTSNLPWYEFKIRVRNELLAIPPGQYESGFSINMGTAGDTVGSHIDIFAHGYAIQAKSNNQASPGSPARTTLVEHDFTDWTTITVLHAGSAVIIYINGVFSSRSDLFSDATASNSIIFGRVDPNASEAVYEIERYSYGRGIPYPRPNQTVAQYLSDVAVFDRVIDDQNEIDSLQLYSPLALYGDAPKKPRVTPIVKNWRKAYPAQLTGASSTFDETSSGQMLFVSDGLNPITLSYSIEGYTQSQAAPTSFMLGVVPNVTALTYMPSGTFPYNLAPYQLTLTQAPGTPMMQTPSLPVANFYSPTIPANISLPISIQRSHTAIYPAGTWSFGIRMATGAGTGFYLLNINCGISS